MAYDPFKFLGKTGSKKMQALTAADENRQNEEQEKDQSEIEKARKAKKKGKADDDGEDAPEDEQPEAEKNARARERARIKSIFLSGAGRANPVAAAHMGLDTDMPRAEAISAIENLNAALAASAAARNAKAGDPARMTAAAILAAGAKARGEAPSRMPGQRERMGYRPGEEPRLEPQRGTALGADGRRVDAAAQAIVDAGRRRRGEAV